MHFSLYVVYHNAKRTVTYTEPLLTIVEIFWIGNKSCSMLIGIGRNHKYQFQFKQL